MARQRNKPQATGGGAPGWMVTYGDMMSLLLTFFVLLFSLSTLDQRKIRKALGSLRGALGILKGTDTKTLRLMVIAPMPELQEKRTRLLLTKKIRKLAHDGEYEGALDATELPGGVAVTLLDSVLFEPGASSLKPEAFPILTSVFRQLKKTDYKIRVNGHTDASGEAGENWQLSADRALSVVKFAIGKTGIKPWRLSATGHASFKPVATNATSMGRAKNRRVEIICYHDSGDVRKKLEKDIIGIHGPLMFQKPLPGDTAIQLPAGGMSSGS